MKKRIKPFLRRFSDFILGFLVGVMVITLGRMAMADITTDLVNSKIKEEFFKMERDQRKADLEFKQVRPLEELNSTVGALPHRPVEHFDALINHADNISDIEQSPSLDQPRAGISQKIDPLNAVENQLADEQARELYREHYRGAVKNIISSLPLPIAIPKN